MTQAQKDQIAGEIENEEFSYWLQNYASSSLRENDAPQYLIDLAKKAADALDEAESAFEKEGLFVV